MTGDKLALGAVAALAALGLAKRRGSRAPYLDRYEGFTTRRPDLSTPLGKSAATFDDAKNFLTNMVLYYGLIEDGKAVTEKQRVRSRYRNPRIVPQSWIRGPMEDPEIKNGPRWERLSSMTLKDWVRWRKWKPVSLDRGYGRNVHPLAWSGSRSKRGSRSDQLSLGLQQKTRPRKRQKTRPRKRRPCPDRFYSPKNQAVDAQGQPLVFYHGSRTPDIKRFTTDENTTAYGLFFAPDFNTAAFYGPYVYKVHLYVENLIDLDESLRTVAQQSSFEDSTRMMMSEWGEYIEPSTSDLNRTLYDLIEGQQDNPAVRRVLSQWMDTLDEDIPEDERWEHLRHTLDCEEPEEDDEVIQKIFLAGPPDPPAVQRCTPDAEP